MATRTATRTRRLDDTSWLAQSINDMMVVESERCGQSSRWLVMRTLLTVVRYADTGEREMFYTNDQQTNNRLVVIPSIPSGMQPDLLGLDARYQGTAQVLVTHGLNSAVINVSRLMEAIR